MKINYLMIAIALLLTVNAMRAQQTRLRWHTVQGLVIDDSGRPISRATVYLQDADHHRLRMKQTDRSGEFNFGLVDTDKKYEIYAEDTNLTSEKLPVVTTESKRQMVFRLVLKNTDTTSTRNGSR